MDMEHRMYGPNLVEVLQLAFQYCELNNIKTFNRLTKMANMDWMTFLDRNRDIPLRTPEATSIQRAIGFNGVRVAGFYDYLSSIIFNDNTRVRFLPELIDKAPTGTIEKATKSVWINSEISNYWCDHSAQQIQPTHRTQSALLILDDHSIHTMNLGLIRKAREKNDTTVSNLLNVPANCRR
ncbi:hypothetical protein LSH36_2g08006 [Paralvinella palmiformis]|uniref:Uncharacterized protein n=1 Tax=Paralvinella palmiformis TaxID=53620 RepID=A0AAD9NHS2_9ANNE|nr:hypothetical protein LSH36_2g08006 [Paralvinella palmiformis]